MVSTNNEFHFTSGRPALEALWFGHNLPASTLEQISFTGNHPVLSSSFAVSTAVQASVGAAVGMAAVIAQHRGIESLCLSVDSIDAALECTGYFEIDGVSPPQFAPLSGLYKTRDGHIRLHANFDHHRDIALNAVDLPAGPAVSKEKLQTVISKLDTESLDEAITVKGGACSTLRSFEQWDKHPQALALRDLPLIEITKTGDADPRPLSPIKSKQLPLSGIRALDLTRILAGPVCGRTLAAYGAEVMLINSPDLPNIDSIAETSRGKLSSHADLQTKSGRETLHKLLVSSNVFIQGYRPVALEKLGFGADDIISQYPGIVYTSLSAYGRRGPWNQRRGYDSLVQTATGFNAAEASAFSSSTPKALPVQALDYATGFLMAFGTQIALHRQALEGGSYHVQLSLARTGQWLRDMGQSTAFLNCEPLMPESKLVSYPSAWGSLSAIPHAAKIKTFEQQWVLPSVPPGTNTAEWPSKATT